ncbi:MAG: sodium:alanine symporter family protein [Salinivirgaceae bacterium]|jgi:AGCS family alanine or glycine:cation symporter|nr:sodium:alanine symporter family protein [Salinivirgaceae bacterium]
MQKLNEFFLLIDGYIGGSAWFVYALIGTGLFFTIYLKFPQIRYFKHAFKIVTGKFDKKDDVGDTSHFQALTTALSGTVGTGNIAGVAFAIHLGGPAALFWMLVTAMVGMTTKFVEVTLSHKYREIADDGTVSGGPMYYMKNKLNMKWLAVIFAIATVVSSFGTGNLPQINSISHAINATFGIPNMITGAVLAVLLAFVIIGGIKRIAKVTSRLIPIMAFIYLIGAFAVILTNYENIIPSFVSIFTDLFSGTAATGGFLGATVAFAFNRGVNRGLYSNEAGQGSAPIAHAAAKAHEPVSEGMVAILEPFIDTIVICFITGLVLLSSGVWSEKHENTFQSTDLIVLTDHFDEADKEDIETLNSYFARKGSIPMFTGELQVLEGELQSGNSILHARSFAENIEVAINGTPFTGNIVVNNGVALLEYEGQTIEFKGESLLHSAPLTTVAFTRSFFGEWGKYIVSIGLLLFAFSTAISWSYYGDRAMTFLLGTKSVVYYRVVYVVGFFVASFMDTTIIWTFAGITIAMMTLPNLFGILMLRKDMKQTVKDYWVSFKKDNPE